MIPLTACVYLLMTHNDNMTLVMTLVTYNGAKYKNYDV